MFGNTRSDLSPDSRVLLAVPIEWEYLAMMYIQLIKNKQKTTKKPTKKTNTKTPNKKWFMVITWFFRLYNNFHTAKQTSLHGRGVAYH